MEELGPGGWREAWRRFRRSRSTSSSVTGGRYYPGPPAQHPSATIVAVTGSEIIGLLGLAAAALAAFFAYPAWKASRSKPDLRFVIEPGPPTSAKFWVKLRNDGEGPAVDWMATVEVPPSGRLYPDDYPRGTPGWSDKQTPTGWTATWLASGSDDSIGVGLHREVLASTGGGYETEGRYAVRAARMRENTGYFRVSIVDDAERKQTIDVSLDPKARFQWLLLEYWEDKRSKRLAR